MPTSQRNLIKFNKKIMSYKDNNVSIVKKKQPL